MSIDKAVMYDESDDGIMVNFSGRSRAKLHWRTENRRKLS